MSTRATYLFMPGQNSLTRTTCTIYVHYDGYAKGAACYFYQTLVNQSKGCFATQFIRAVEQAELTESHGHHGDTEYRYTVRGMGPDAELSANWRDIQLDKWKMFFHGPLRVFIDANGRESIPEFTGLEYHPFKLVKLNYRSAWFDETTARQYLERDHGPLKHLRAWSQSGAIKPGAAN